MSLDVILKRTFQISYDNGKTIEEKEEYVYGANITHNLGQMADKAGIYEALWRPYRLKQGYDIPENNYELEYINDTPTGKPVKKDDHYMNAFEYGAWGVKTYLDIKI